VREAARRAGCSEAILTTMADIYSGPYGLPDEPPYNETVVKRPGVPKDDRNAILWERYLWRMHHAGKQRV
jgi:hypothetical protein